MARHIPGFTFGDLVRQPELEQRGLEPEEWYDNMGHRVPEPEGGVFVGRLAYGPHLVASVVRNGFSRGGYLGLYEMAFLDPTKGRQPFGGEFYDPKDLGLHNVSLTWMSEEQVTAVLQRVARRDTVMIPLPTLVAAALAVFLTISALAWWMGWIVIK